MGYGVALQASCLEGFDSLGLHQFYLSEALSGCVHGLGPCGQGSNPCRETKFRILTAKINNTLLLKRKGTVRLRSRKVWCNGSTMLNVSCFIRPFSIMVLHLFCNQVTAVRFCHGAPSFRSQSVHGRTYACHA